MRTTTPALFFIAFLTLTLAASACKRNQPSSPEETESEAPTSSGDDEAAPTSEAEPEDPAGAASGKTVAPDRVIAAMPLPEDWFKVTTKSPKGATISFGVPGGWVEAKPPNESTLLMRFAPADSPAAGTQATVVAPEFKGGLSALVQQTRQRLEGFASVKGDSSVRVNELDGHEFAASWATPMGNRDTVQLIFATGEESIGVSCQMPPDKLEELSGLCDEIFATLSIEGATLQP